VPGGYFECIIIVVVVVVIVITIIILLFSILFSFFLCVFLFYFLLFYVPSAITCIGDHGPKTARSFVVCGSSVVLFCYFKQMFHINFSL